MRSNRSTIEEEAEEIEYENIISHSIYLGFLLRYITLTNYYIVQHTCYLFIVCVMMAAPDNVSVESVQLECPTECRCRNCDPAFAPLLPDDKKIQWYFLIWKLLV